MGLQQMTELVTTDEMNYWLLNDTHKLLTTPWQVTINKTNRGYSYWFELYLDYVAKLNE